MTLRHYDNCRSVVLVKTIVDKGVCIRTYPRSGISHGLLFEEKVILGGADDTPGY